MMTFNGISVIVFKWQHALPYRRHVDAIFIYIRIVPILCVLYSKPKWTFICYVCILYSVANALMCDLRSTRHTEHNLLFAIPILFARHVCVCLCVCPWRTVRQFQTDSGTASYILVSRLYLRYYILFYVLRLYSIMSMLKYDKTVYTRIYAYGIMHFTFCWFDGLFQSVGRLTFSKCGKRKKNKKNGLI